MAGRSKSRNKAPTDIKSAKSVHPGAWTWSNYVAQLPQSEDEKKRLERIALKTSNVLTTDKSGISDERIIFKKRSLVAPTLLFFLLCSLWVIYILSDKVIDLQSYRLANYENICGDPADTNLNGVEFVKKLAQRENCLIQNRHRNSGLTTSLNTLKQALFDRE